MSKKQNRIQMLIQILKSIEAIKNDAGNQNEQSIIENMSVLQESILNVLAIDEIRPIPLDSKVGD